jgi:xanthine dehydrogenase YagT iron-sulfur-binding subunit
MNAALDVSVDGTWQLVTVDTCVTVLAALRGMLEVTSPKKGCDHGSAERALCC